MISMVLEAYLMAVVVMVADGTLQVTSFLTSGRYDMRQILSFSII